MAQPPQFGTLNRRDFLRVAAGMSAGLIGASLIGCTAQAPASSAAAFSLGTDITTLDPQNETIGQATAIRRHMFETLVERDDELKLVPLLAASWRNVNPTTWEFKLRENVKFHDGQPFTSADAKFSIERILDKKLALKAQSFIATVDHVDIIDPMTISIVTKAPDPILINRLSTPAIVMLPSQTLQKVGPDQFFKAPVGSGPYKFVEWVKDDHLTMEAFAGHWAGKPKIDKLTHKPIIEASTRVAALRTGAVDLIGYVEPQQVAELQADSKLEVVFVRSPRTYMVIMNSFVKPFNDVRVRQAMNYAVDVDAIIKELLSDRATRVPSILGPDWFGYDSEQKPYVYDPVKAKALLAEAGYPNGFDVPFMTPKGRFVLDAEIAQAVSGYLAKVGIRANVAVTEYGNFMARLLDYNKGSNPISMVYLGYGGSALDVDDMLQAWLDPKRRGAYYTDPKHEELMAQGLTTLDPEARKGIYRQLLANLYDKAPWIFLFNMNDAYAFNRRLKGYRPRGDEISALWKASVS